MSTYDTIGLFVFDNSKGGSIDVKVQEEQNQEKYTEMMYMHQLYNGIIKKQRYALRGSKLTCSYGTSYSLLDAVQDHGIYKGDYGVLTTIDTGKSNICDFGSCLCPESNYAGRLSMTVSKRNGIPAVKASCNTFAHICVPLVPEGSEWKQVDSTVLAKTCAKGYASLLRDDAVLVCLYGGIIRIVEIPQTGETKGSSQPLNDYKTTENPNLIGISSSKSYITLAQLNSFGFEYNRQTYINKLAGYSTSDFQGVTSNATSYYNEVQNHLDYLNNEFSNISNQDIISNFNYYIEKYNIGKYDEAVLMFMAITAQESLYGIRMAELWDSTLGYNYNQRGGGYSQLTGITSSNPSGNQIPFMSSIGYSSNDINNVLDLPFHIATYLPFSSACYAWTKGNAMSDDITTNIVEYGINKGAEMKLIYLAISYAINGGYTKSGLQTLLNGKIFSEPSTPPNGWADRKASYNKAINIFSNGTSSFAPF